MKLRTFGLFSLCMALTGGAAFGQADFQITELYTGISGPDGSEDFIEITNFGTASGNLSGLFYDDSSLDNTEGGDLPAFELAPGEQAIILVGIDNSADYPAAIAEFEATFGTFANLGATGGGGLSQNGDTAALLDAGNVVLDEVTYPAFTAIATVDISNGGGTAGILGLSTPGVNGAILSAPIVNTNFGTPIVRVAHSLPVTPAAPEPTAFALAAMGLAAFGSRRRRG